MKNSFRTCHSIIENKKLPMSISATARGGNLRRWMDELTWAMVCPVQGTVQRSVWNLNILPCKFSFIWNTNWKLALAIEWKYPYDDQQIKYYQTIIALRSKIQSRSSNFFTVHIFNKIMKNLLLGELLNPSNGLVFTTLLH